MPHKLILNLQNQDQQDMHFDIGRFQKCLYDCKAVAKGGSLGSEDPPRER